MPQFFVRASDIADGNCRIAGEDFLHLARSRRVAEGHRISLRDERGVRYTARVVGVGAASLDAIIEERVDPAPAGPSLVLCAAMLKGGVYDDVVRSAVEVGVTRLVPFVSERTVPTGEGAASKLARWRRIALEAAKQSLRETVPAIEGPLALAEVLSLGRGVRVMAHPGAEYSIAEALAGAEGPGEIWLLVGPEGGFSPVERDAALAAGWRLAGFGFSQMRAATAAMVLPAIVIYEWSRNREDSR